ncbi:MAG: hypothetical protein NTV72_01460 [Candidatus Taylorbacteria bacterium]|nr:hypothetical protein [Candidatus Taylorbacteria bacterium]
MPKQYTSTTKDKMNTTNGGNRVTALAQWILSLIPVDLTKRPCVTCFSCLFTQDMRSLGQEELNFRHCFGNLSVFEHAVTAKLQELGIAVEKLEWFNPKDLRLDLNNCDQVPGFLAMVERAIGERAEVPEPLRKNIDDDIDTGKRIDANEKRKELLKQLFVKMEWNKPLPEELRSFLDEKLPKLVTELS